MKKLIPIGSLVTGNRVIENRNRGHLSVRHAIGPVQPTCFRASGPWLRASVWCKLARAAGQRSVRFGSVSAVKVLPPLRKSTAECRFASRSVAHWLGVRPWPQTVALAQLSVLPPPMTLSSGIRAI